MDPITTATATGLGVFSRNRRSGRARRIRSAERIQQFREELHAVPRPDDREVWSLVSRLIIDFNRDNYVAPVVIDDLSHNLRLLDPTSAADVDVRDASRTDIDRILHLVFENATAPDPITRNWRSMKSSKFTAATRRQAREERYQ